jgi:hypothetical protein
MKVPEEHSAKDMDALVNELAAAEMRYKTAKADVERLRHDMALAKCPFKEGDTIGPTKNGKDYDGIVVTINAAPLWLDAPHDVNTDENIDWIARGKRINSTTGQPGKWSFEIAGNSSSQERGRWRHKTLNETLGISDHDGDDEDEGEEG